MEPRDAHAKTAEPDAVAIEATIQDYFLGMYHQDLNRLRSAFHPNARLFGHLDGTFVEMSLNEWLEKVQNRAIPSANGETFDMSIRSVEITGKIAAAKVSDLYRGLRFTDYLHLAKLEARWVIVNKTFHHD